MEANLDPAKRNKGGTKGDEEKSNGPSLGEARRLHLSCKSNAPRLP